MTASHDELIGSDPIGVVVVNFGSSRLLAQHLSALTEGPALKIVVVDNYSGATELAAVSALARQHGWNVVPLADNRGFAAGVNAGVVRAWQLGCDSVVLLNPDARADNEVVQALHEACQRQPRAMIAPVVLTSTGAVYSQGSQLDMTNGRISRLGAQPSGRRGGVTSLQTWLTAACLALHRQAWDAVGGMDERYFLYWEDVEFSVRAAAVGLELVVRPELTVVHDEGGTQHRRDDRAKSDIYYYYNCRNRLLFAGSHLSRSQLASWVVRTPAASWEILLRGGRRQLLRSTRPLRAAVAGTVAGLRMAVGELVRSRRANLKGTECNGEKRVLMVHPGAELYGSDRVFLEAVSALTERGAKVVALLPEGGPLVAEIEARGGSVQLAPMPVIRKSALRPGGCLRLAGTAMASLPSAVRVLRQLRPDAVYVSTITLPWWVVLARLSGRRTICHVHEAERSASPAVRWLLATPNRAAHAIVVNSRFSRDTLIASVPALAARTVVLLNAVPGPSAPAPPGGQLTLPVNLLYLGRLSPRKGPDVAIKVAQALLESGRDVRLTVLGAPFNGYEWYRLELARLADGPVLRDHVQFLGFDNNVWPHLEHADIVLVPSQVDEPFGNTAVEAVLAARPLVVSDTSGLREAADGYASAQAVAPDSLPAWTAAVEDVIDNWDCYAGKAERDSELARERHSPTTFRRRLVATILPSTPAD